MITTVCLTALMLYAVVIAMHIALLRMRAVHKAYTAEFKPVAKDPPQPFPEHPNPPTPTTSLEYEDDLRRFNR